MSRPDPKSPPPVSRNEKPGWVTQIRKYKVITPLYGGGEETQKADSITTVRAPEVRGHLRFWWRATRGGVFNGDLPEMKRRENEIWGASATKDETSQSKVVIVIRNADSGVADHPFEVVDNAAGRPQVRARSGSSANPYAAFPLQPEQQGLKKGMETKSVRNNVAFTLEIQYHKDYKEDLTAALWAWEYFGGLGARTRRGFGALQCLEVDGTPEPLKSSQELEEFLFKEIKSNSIQNGVWHPGVPHLSNDIKRYRVTQAQTDSLGAWKNLIDSLKKFRQSRRDGAERNRPGRSYWSEPEAIRTLANQRHPNHQPLLPVINKFPRAKFGLPIIFHFKDANRHNPNDPRSDPRDTSLQGLSNDRLASPLILRPITCSDGTVGLAAILEWVPIGAGESYTPPGGLILKGAPHDPQVESNLSENEANAIKPLSGKTDILQAFLDNLK